MPNKLRKRFGIRDNDRAFYTVIDDYVIVVTAIWRGTRVVPIVKFPDGTYDEVDIGCLQREIDGTLYAVSGYDSVPTHCPSWNDPAPRTTYSKGG